MIYDVFIIVILILCIIVGYTRGAAKTLVSLLGFLASFLLSVFLGDYLSELIYNNYVSEAIVNSLKDSLTISGSASLSSLPPFVSFALSVMDFDGENALSNAVANAPIAVASAFETTIRPVVLSLLSFIITSLLFALILFVFKLILKKLLLFLFRLPILSLINNLLGGALGVVNAVLIISFCAYLLRIIIPYMNTVSFIFSESTIYNSYIFYHFYSGNIFNAVISIF